MDQHIVESSGSPLYVIDCDKQEIVAVAFTPAVARCLVNGFPSYAVFVQPDAEQFVIDTANAAPVDVEDDEELDIICAGKPAAALA